MMVKYLPSNAGEVSCEGFLRGVPDVYSMKMLLFEKKNLILYFTTKKQSVQEIDKGSYLNYSEIKISTA